MPERLLTGGLEFGSLPMACLSDGIRQVFEITVCEVVQGAWNRALQLLLERFDSFACHS